MEFIIISESMTSFLILSCRRYYPNEVLYWKGVSQENNRLLKKIFNIEKGKVVEKKPIPMSSKESCKKACSVEGKSTYFREYGRTCSKLRRMKKNEEDRGDKVEVEVCFEDPDTGNIIRENLEVSTDSEVAQAMIDVQVDLRKNRNRGTMTPCWRPSVEDIITDHLVDEHLPVSEVRRAVDAIADNLYRPPWK